MRSRWALVNAGDVHEASALIERALAEGTADARLSSTHP